MSANLILYTTMTYNSHVLYSVQPGTYDGADGRIQISYEYR